MENDASTFGRFRPQGLIARLMAATRGARSHWIGKRQAFFLRALGIKVLRGRPLDVETFGANMRLYPSHNHSEKKLLFTPQFFDAEELAFLKSRLTPAFVFVDIGADVGGYALFVAALAGPRARILAIEPQPEIFERLVFNIRQNAFPSVKALACAVADRDGMITLFVNPNNTGETSMRVVNAHAQSRQVTVQARALATLLADEGIARVDAMKLDVEGAEDLILEPFFADMPASAWPAILIVENSPASWSIDLPALLRGRGYTLVLRTAMNVVYERAAEPPSNEYAA